MNKIVVLGTGLVGKFVADKLSEEGFEVRACDVNRTTFKNKVEFVQCDITSKTNFKMALKDIDVVVNALPGSIAYNILLQCIEAKKHVVDFSFMSEDVLSMSDFAKHYGVTVLTDFGFAPGISHMFTARLVEELPNVEAIEIWVGGLPKDQVDEYKAVFSPRDIIEEYIRPARYIDNGEVKSEDPFAKSYFCHFDQRCFGFISDGLRTLLDLNVKSLAEYTMRYKEHFWKMRYLKEDGFFDPEHLEHTAKVLTDKWKLKENDKDFSILKVIGGDKNQVISYSFYDAYDTKNKIHSMARATGLPVVAGVKALVNHKWESGIFPPEKVALNEVVFKEVWKYLKDNGIKLSKKIQHKIEGEAT